MRGLSATVLVVSEVLDVIVVLAVVACGAKKMAFAAIGGRVILSVRQSRLRVIRCDRRDML
jgi:hypothetical protein